MRIIKCYFLTCQQTIEVDIDETPQAAGSTRTLAPGATFGHSQYVRVPFLVRDEHKLSGKPWLCPYHEVMLEATLALTSHEEQQRQSLVAQIRTGRMIKGDTGFYAQVPPKPVVPFSVREDNGDIRTSTVVWFTPEQAIAKMSGEPQSTAYRPEASDAE
jgi:hypothetical protein